MVRTVTRSEILCHRARIRDFPVHATAPAETSTMFLGIDLHDHESQVAVVDDDGNLQDEIRLPTNRLDELAEEYAGGEAAIEASSHYRAAYEMLDEHLDVTVANPSKNRVIAGATVKTSRLDAQRLAPLLHPGGVAEGYVRGDNVRA